MVTIYLKRISIILFLDGKESIPTGTPFGEDHRQKKTAGNN
jgi:hypothetical protein